MARETPELPNRPGNQRPPRSGEHGDQVCDRFVTLSMKASADFRAVHEQATRVLEAYDTPYQVSAAGAPEAAPAAFDGAALGEDEKQLLRQIDAVLDDRIRPFLANDGGGLEVVGLDGKTLQIRYQGACGSCPSAIAGTLMAIQNLLQSEVDEQLSVVSV